MKHTTDVCSHCEESYYAEAYDDGERISELRERECQCGEAVFCQGCVSEQMRCSHPGCKEVFCSEECASGTNLNEDLYCAGHMPQPIQADPVVVFVSALEQFVAASESLRQGLEDAA